KLFFWFIACSAIWVVIGTLIGEYLGLKFAWPDLGVDALLSFGRLRPIHTNTVFWGWASVGMIGLAYYVVPRTSKRELYSYKLGWIAFALINITVLAGSLQLLFGINNGGQEYREYIWPIMALFAIALILSIYNLYKTVATRELEEIY